MDWRLKDNPNFLNGALLKKIIFPDYWEKAFQEESAFYQMIKDEAKSFVNKHKTDQKFLVGDKIQDFWHTHCAFCTKKITTRKSMVCYCTQDYAEWICDKCFEDFNQILCWQVLERE